MEPSVYPSVSLADWRVRGCAGRITELLVNEEDAVAVGQDLFRTIFPNSASESFVAIEKDPSSTPASLALRRTYFSLFCSCRLALESPSTTSPLRLKRCINNISLPNATGLL